MGIYDEVGKNYIQIKCTPDPSMYHYKIGDPVGLQDGLYIGYEGWFVVDKGKVEITGKDIFDKWRDKLICGDIINPYSPVVQAIKELKDSQ